jgi:dCMP deaminase
MDEHEEFLRLAVMASRLSPDDSTRNGAVLVSRDGNFVRACNETPPGIVVTEDRVSQPGKYTFVEHAERMVLYKAAMEGLVTADSKMYCLWYACSHCARAIVCAGVREVIGLQALNLLTPARWREQVDTGHQILKEAGVRCRLFTEPLGLRVRFDGSELTI